VELGCINQRAVEKKMVLKVIFVFSIGNPDKYFVGLILIGLQSTRSPII